MGKGGGVPNQTSIQHISTCWDKQLDIVPFLRLHVTICILSGEDNWIKYQMLVGNGMNA